MSNFEQEIRNRQFKQATGSAPTFRSIDGVGPKTAEKVKGTIIEGEGRIQAPQDVSDLTDDQLADKAGISKNRARKVIKGAGGNPDREPRSTTGSVSAAGIKLPQGEFVTEVSDQDKAEAKFSTSRNRGIGRSQNAAIADKGKRAPVTTDFERWKNNKGELDFPGVDTPTESPDVRPKDLRQEQRPDTTDPQQSAAARSTVPESPSTERNTSAPLPFTTGLSERGVSLSPEEAFEGTAAGSNRELGGLDNRDFTDSNERRGRDLDAETTPEQAFMQSGDSGGGMGVSLTSEDRSVLETLARSNMASGGRAERIEEARLSDDPSTEAREAVVETGESILNFRDEIESPKRTDTDFISSDDLDRIDSVVSKFQGGR
jgi:hypothetical protein